MMDPYVRRRDKTKIAGVCPACEKEVEGRSGLRNDAVLRHHMFYICHEYPKILDLITPILDAKVTSNADPRCQGSAKWR